jgi:hypothetical protein
MIVRFRLAPKNCQTVEANKMGPQWEFFGRVDLDIKAGAAKLKADRAARIKAELVVDRWNRRLPTGHAGERLFVRVVTPA